MLISTGITTGTGALRLAVEAVTHSGRAAQIVIYVGDTDVRVIHYGSHVARFPTWEVRRWLAAADRLPLQAGDLTLTVDGSLDRDHPRVAVTLPDVTAWSLSPGQHDDFVTAVSGAGV